MAVNPFATVSDYPSMLNKIAAFNFFVSLIAVAVIVWRVPYFGTIHMGLTVKVPETGVEVPVAILLVALLIALISRMVKLHDRVSDLFGIRKRFDVYDILLPMASASGVVLSLDQQERIRAERHELMKNAFYKYASSSPGRAQIDQHVITMALDQWSWYWICTETICILAVSGVVLAICRQYAASTLLSVIVLLLIALLQPIREFCRGYARDEIAQILEDPSRLAAVQGVFRAL